jgi:hypothetical protein
MTATTPLLQGQQYQLNYFASSTTAKMPSVRATIAIATMAKTPARQWQHCHHNEGNSAIAVTAWMPAHQ